jgi:hypothetical protein
MYLLFVDESGTPELGSDLSKVFCLVGTAINIEKYKDFSNDLFNLKSTFFRETMSRPETGDRKMNKRIRESKELKDILQPSKINPRNIRFMKALVNDCINKYQVSVHPVIFLKEQLDNKPLGSWIYPLAFKRVIASFNNFLVTKNSKGLVLLDSRDYESDDKLISSFYSYTSSNPFGIKCDNIIGPPLFARSFMTPGLELAHHIAYITFCQYTHCFYHKLIPIDYSKVSSYWQDLSNSNTIFGNINSLKGIVAWG